MKLMPMIALALLVTGPHAQADTVALGTDGVTCTTWKSVAGMPLRASLQKWVLGFVSGAVAGAGVDALTNRNAGEVIAQVDLYCSYSPQQTLAHSASVVAAMFVQEWRDRQ